MRSRGIAGYKLVRMGGEIFKKINGKKTKNRGMERVGGTDAS